MNIASSKIITVVSYALMLCIIIVACIVIGPIYSRIKQLERKEMEMCESIREKNKEIAKISEYQQRFRSDRDFVEMIVRRNRRVLPGELIFIFED